MKLRDKCEADVQDHAVKAYAEAAGESFSSWRAFRAGRDAVRNYRRRMSRRARKAPQV